MSKLRTYDDRDYRDAVDDISNIALDFAESKLHELIQELRISIYKEEE